MKVLPTKIPDVLIIEPDVFHDERGFFVESFNQRRFAEVTGIHVGFVQDNHSSSRRGALHGLHHQGKRPQGKLVRVACGKVFDVAVDLRKTSACFGAWVGVELSSENHRQMWIPPGFAHGYLVLSERVEFLYKVTDYHVPEEEHCIAWHDATLAIAWPLDGLGIPTPLVSHRDRHGEPFAP